VRPALSGAPEFVALGPAESRHFRLRDVISAADSGCGGGRTARILADSPLLLQHLPCDYSDTHKNKEWQGYVAMAVAVYVKYLLCRIPLNKVEAESRISDLLSRG
jgi:hypothetical protein